MESNGQLKFIKVDDINLIPKPLLEQVKGQDWELADVYKLWPLFNNRFNFLYALANEGKVKGVIWLTVLPLSRTLFINVLSLAKEVQGKHFVEEQFHPFMQRLCKQLGCKNYKGITTRPKGFERLGFNRDRKALVTVEV